MRGAAPNVLRFRRIRSGMAEAPDSPVIQRGTAWVMFAYDAALGIDLEEARRRIPDPASDRPESGLRRRPTPAYFRLRPPPLRVTERLGGGGGGALTVAGIAVDERVECALYDFGAISILYRLPIAGPVAGLGALAEALYDNAALLADSRRRVESLVARLGAALRSPELAPVVEDYVVYHAPAWDGGGAADGVIERGRRAMAQVLRAEAEPLSEQEVADALACRVSYGERDAVVIDWNAAMLLGPEAEDVLGVLEFANIELLEMRILDDRLDGALEEAYAGLWRGGRAHLSPARNRRDLARVATLQLDAAMLFEGVNNALKLIGDQYLARLYRVAAQRLHLAEWDASILRKLQTLESLYQKASDRQSAWRMEILEWIIIVLIAASMVIPFVVGK